MTQSDLISHISESLTTLPFEEMKRVKLMNRIDTKFVTTESRLADLLIMAKNEA